MINKILITFSLACYILLNNAIADPITLQQYQQAQTDYTNQENNITLNTTAIQNETAQAAQDQSAANVTRVPP